MPPRALQRLPPIPGGADRRQIAAAATPRRRPAIQRGPPTPSIRDNIANEPTTAEPIHQVENEHGRPCKSGGQKPARRRSATTRERRPCGEGRRHVGVESRRRLGWCFPACRLPPTRSWRPRRRPPTAAATAPSNRSRRLRLSHRIPPAPGRGADGEQHCRRQPSLLAPNQHVPRSLRGKVGEHPPDHRGRRGGGHHQQQCKASRLDREHQRRDQPGKDRRGLQRDRRRSPGAGGQRLRRRGVRQDACRIRQAGRRRREPGQQPDPSGQPVMRSGWIQLRGMGKPRKRPQIRLPAANSSLE